MCLTPSPLQDWSTHSPTAGIVGTWSWVAFWDLPHVKKVTLPHVPLSSTGHPVSNDWLWNIKFQLFHPNLRQLWITDHQRLLKDLLRFFVWITLQFSSCLYLFLFPPRLLVPRIYQMIFLLANFYLRICFLKDSNLQRTRPIFKTSTHQSWG